MPKVSIITGIYNCSAYLIDAINSIQNQTLMDWELILCDDGSTDNTFQIAQQFAAEDPRIRLLHNEKNCGLNKTLNRCLAIATGEYIARMDGDDISLPERLEKETAFLDAHPEFAVVSSPMIYFDEAGEYRRGRGGHEVNAESFPKGTPVPHAPCMVRREAYLSVGGYTDAKNRMRVEDWDLWLKMYRKGYRMYCLDECLYMMRDGREAFHRRKYRYRLNEASVSAEAVKQLKLSPKYYVYVLRPLLVGLLPKPIYMWLHKRNTG